MTIKEELREAYQKRIGKWKPTSRFLKTEGTDVNIAARKFIEEIIIIKFREIAAKKPFKEYLFIEFNYSDKWFRFFSNVDPLTYIEKDSLVTKEVLEKAIEIAKKEYDIDTIEEKTWENNIRYVFYLYLS